MKKTININIQTIKKIEKCLNDYKINLPSKTIVGCSGGKDSTSLLFFLRELGVEPIPIVVDVGYTNFNPSAIKETIDQFGFDTAVIKTRSKDTLADIPQGLMQKVLHNFKNLDLKNCPTPCTYCSRIKRIFLIHEALKCNHKTFLLGHHREDMITTLLKDYFIYGYYGKYGVYQKNLFENYIKTKKIVIQELVELVSKERAGTMGIRLIVNNHVNLFRPMAYVSEAEVINFITDNKIPTYKSGCPHEFYVKSELIPNSKREFVHKELCSRLNNNIDGDELLTIARNSLDHIGQPKFFPRKNRAKLMPAFEQKGQEVVIKSL